MATIRGWFHQIGKDAYPGAEKLLVCADGGGSGGYRLRAWKTELATLAGQTDLSITVCHLPPGTSEWNNRAPTLQPHLNELAWSAADQPPGIVDAHRRHHHTHRTEGPRRARQSHLPPTGIKISDAQIAALPITGHDSHGDWHYTFRPTRHNRVLLLRARSVILNE